MHPHDRITAIRIELVQHWRCGSDTRAIEQHLDQLQDEIADEQNTLTHIRAQLAELLRRTPDRVPTHVTVTTEGNLMSYAPGQTITFTAVSNNAEGFPVADQYTWTVSAGTPIAGPDSSSITVSDAPLGDVTATATDLLGLAGSVTVSVVDQTPATVTVTAS
jgi:UDP-N-acetylglucosamine enolpyruvyl transferase